MTGIKQPSSHEPFSGYHHRVVLKCVPTSIHDALAIGST
jgi:hypothetical protein